MFKIALGLWLNLFSLVAFGSVTITIPKTVIQITNLTQHPVSDLKVNFWIGCRYGYEGTLRCGESKKFDLIVDHEGKITIEAFDYVLKASRYRSFVSMGMKLSFGNGYGNSGGWGGSLDSLGQLNKGITLFKMTERTAAPKVDGLSVTEWLANHGASSLHLVWNADLDLPRYTYDDSKWIFAKTDEITAPFKGLTLYQGQATDATKVNYKIMLKLDSSWISWEKAILLQEDSTFVPGVSFKTH